QEYLIWLVFPVLLISMLVYFRIAKKYNIVDKPNSRSSHSEIIINSGGIIFPVAMIVYTAFYKWSNFYTDEFPYFLLGMLMISAVSMADDIKGLSAKFRLLVHFVSVTALMMYVDAFSLLSAGMVVLAYILIIGSLNAYNFMDGINGMTGFYSIIGFLTLLYINNEIAFTDSNFLIVAIIA